MVNYVIIPAHNEEKTIKETIDEAKKHTPNVVVVNDGSTDKTTEICQHENITLISHKINLGKGAALKTGCDYVLTRGAKNIVVIDADGQHDPDLIPVFFKGLEDIEIVFSHREKPKNMPIVLKFGNMFINKLLTLLYGIEIKDSQCGYRAFTADAYKKVRWNANDYFMETEMIINAGKAKLKYTQIPIKTVYNDRFKGTTVKDGVSIVMKLISSRFFK